MSLPRATQFTSYGPITSPTYPLTLAAIQDTIVGMSPQQTTSGGLGPGDQYVPSHLSYINTHTVVGKSIKYKGNT